MNANGGVPLASPDSAWRYHEHQLRQWWVYPRLAQLALGGALMPTLVAAVLSAIVAAALQSWLKPYVGIRVSAALALVCLTGLFWVTRKWLTRLRDGA